MKNLITTFTLFLSVFIVVGCQKASEYSEYTAPLYKTVWEQQLDSVINMPAEILKVSNISLVSYEFIDKLDNATKITRYKTSLKSVEDMIPYYTSTSMNMVIAMSKSNIMLTKAKYQSCNFDRANKFIDDVVSLGMKIIRLTWNNNGVETKTLCAVSDQDGVVYDNFISNILVIKKNTTASDFSIQSKSDTDPNYTGTKTWQDGCIAEWLWGSERGRAVITHDAFFSSGTIMFHNFNASHYMSIGNSNAQVSEVEKNDKTATIAYGYGLSTPTIDVFLRFYGTYYTLAFSSSFGSTAGGTGHHTHF